MSQEAKLRECLDVALRQWRMHAGLDRQFDMVPDIEYGTDPEAELYRMCLAELEKAKEKA